MHDPDSELPPPGASVRLTRNVFGGGGLIGEAGELGRVFYFYADDGSITDHCIDVYDRPTGAPSRFYFWDRYSFLSCIEPADLGRDPEE